jgi:putative sterol carrier protein
MRGSFRPAKAKDVHARYQWDLSGPTGGQWWIDVNDGTYKMGKGKIDHPSVTFVAKDKDWVAVSNGQLGGTWAYLTGRLKIRGDQGLARKLGEMFP